PASLFAGDEGSKEPVGNHCPAYGLGDNVAVSLKVYAQRLGFGSAFRACSSGPRAARSDSTGDLRDVSQPSLVGMRLNVLYDVVIPGRKRQQKRYYKGTVIAVRESGRVDIEWDDEHSDIDTLDLSSATYHIVR
ncbi:hypothetical protein FOZ61_007110, partial [Perkinsus olseni]